MSLWTDPRRRRWLAWAVLVTSFVLVSVHRLSTAVIAEDLMAAFVASGSGLGTLHAAFFYVYAPLQLVAGVLADRWGARRTATLGTVTMSVGAVAFAAADTYLLALLGRLTVGLGGSLLYITTLRFCANWFRARQFATLSGLTTAGAGVGGIIAATPFALVVAAVGWRVTVGGLAVAGLLVAVAIWVVVRDSPADLGEGAIADVPETPSLTLGAVLTNLRTVARRPITWLAGVALFCVNGINMSLLGLWGVPYVVQSYGLSVPQAAFYTLLGSVGLTVGTPAIGWVSDRLGSRTPLVVVGSALYALSLAILAVAGTPPLPVVGLVFTLAGFLTGAFIVAFTVVVERVAPEESGVATGAVNAIGLVGPAVLPTVMGYALDAYWTGETIGGARVYTTLGYRVAFGITAALAGVGVLAALWLHRRT